MELFENTNVKIEKPLAERMRPRKLSEVIGQNELINNLINFINSDFLPSMIFWGSPGTGKTTIALILSNELNMQFEKLSAVESGVKELRRVIEISDYICKKGIKTFLFIDELHRFNKSQQDSLLHAVESGKLTLIGATTENPSFEVNSALLSRMQVYRLNELNENDIKKILENALKNDDKISKKNIEISELEPIISLSGTDARSALKYLELIINSQRNNIKINKENIEKILSKKIVAYDKKGENHYDTISAFIKSMRGSDPDAAIFWLAKMLDAGEDPKFIARRMVIFASEDIGNAEPFALSLAISVFDAVNLIGMPECRINLAQGVTYLASSPKSNASYTAINEAMSDIKKGVNSIAPMHLRNAPTELMKKEGYSKGYKYPHDHSQNFVKENYFPEKFPKKQYYRPTVNGREAKISERLKKLWEF
jgi:putative ATPase